MSKNVSYDNPYDYPYNNLTQSEFDKKTRDKYNNLMVYYDEKKNTDVTNDENINKSKYSSYRKYSELYDKYHPLCGSDKTERATTTNVCGQWRSARQFYGGEVYKHSNEDCVDLHGALFPTSDNTFVTSNPQNPVVFGYARIGEEYHSR